MSNCGTSAFQTPFFVKPIGPRFLPLHSGYETRFPNSIRFYQLPLRCTLDVPKEVPTLSETESYQLLRNATIVTVKLPLDIYLEEATDGSIFIDELIPGGSGESSGLLHEGDIIVAVSLPYGEGLFPVPKDGGLDMIESYIDTRADDTFKLAIVRAEGVQQLRAKIAESQNSADFSTVRSLMKEIHSSEYPIAPSDEADPSTSDPNFVPDLEALREYGFDLDDIFDSSDRDT